MVTVSQNRPKTLFLGDNPNLFSKVNIAIYESGFQNLCLKDPQDCFNQLVSKNYDLFIIDCIIHDINYIDVIKYTKQLLPWQPILLINGTSRNMPAVIEATKEGALNILKQPFKIDIFINIVKNIINDNHKALSVYHTLTKMEKESLKLVMSGKNLDESSILLNCDKTTLQVHYSNLIKKFNSKSIKNIIVHAARCEFVKFPKI